MSKNKSHWYNFFSTDADGSDIVPSSTEQEDDNIIDDASSGPGGVTFANDNTSFWRNTAIGYNAGTGIGTGSGGNFTFSTGGTSSNVTFEHFRIEETKEECTKCKQKVKMSDIKKRYKYLEIDRRICRKCYYKAMDNIFGLDDIDVDLEETLYKKE